MYGILAEDDSDIQTLKVIIRRLADDKTIPIRGKGFSGCGKLLKDGWKYLKSLPSLNCSRFIFAHDADQRNYREVQRQLFDSIIKPSGLRTSICLLIPVQEIEAWMLADLAAASNIFPGWTPKSVPNPESISSPQEYLEKLSRLGGGRPRFSHAVHNEKLAKHIDLLKVSKHCPSFRPLEDFVKNGKSNF